MRRRERIDDDLDQEWLATAHLAVGYVTIAAVVIGVSALLFRECP